MSGNDRVQALLAGAARVAECKERRVAWVRETSAAWRAAQKAMDDRLDEACTRLRGEEFERLCDEEEAKVDVFRKPLKDAAERDLWPRELYWGGI